MLYTVKASHPHRHVVEFEMLVNETAGDRLLLQLPSWRPGRYELGNFAKNILHWSAATLSGQPLPFRKLNKDLWEVQCTGHTQVLIRYSFYANELTAGSSCFNHEMLYLNPVNCFMYVPGREHEPCELILEGLPEDYEIATQLERNGPRKLIARDFDYLADSPLIASAQLKHFHFQLGEAEVHLWFTGHFMADFGEILEHTYAYCSKQVEIFGEMPCKRYHFLYHILPYRFHHGVEHLDSTVIALGPAANFGDIDFYREFLAVSSHEFYHLWNIKRIRPAEMWPYDFTRENYSRQGYVYEGVTTYMGDLMLLRSGVFDWEEYSQAFNRLLERHFDNPGRYNLSVAASSWDTWLDGYVPGVPGRKVSIYVEGALAAFILDTRIMQGSLCQHRIDELMKKLYHDYYKKNKGYTQEDYIKLAEILSQATQQKYMHEVLEGCGYIEQYMPDAMQAVGCRLHVEESPLYQERIWGCRVLVENGRFIVKQVWPGSPADEAGMAEGDQLLAVGGKEFGAGDELSEWLAEAKENSFPLRIKRVEQELVLQIGAGSQTYYQKRSIVKLPDARAEQKAAFRLWTDQDF